MLGAVGTSKKPALHRTFKLSKWIIISLNDDHQRENISFSFLSGIDINQKGNVIFATSKPSNTRPNKDLTFPFQLGRLLTLEI